MHPHKCIYCIVDLYQFPSFTESRVMQCSGEWNLLVVNVMDSLRPIACIHVHAFFSFVPDHRVLTCAKNLTTIAKNLCLSFHSEIQLKLFDD